MQASSKYTKAIQICMYMNFHKDELISSARLAESLSTNPVVVRRLMKELRDAEVVKSIAGTQGGFQLNKDAKDISLWDIYLLMREEDFFQRPKVNPDCIISSNLKALVHDTFTEAELSMKSSLSSKNIEDLTIELREIVDSPVVS
ncbi:MAG: Rrf2 family transcriptional regulator [Bacteroidota bacterium]